MAIDLGCISNCESIDTGVLADSDGTFTLKAVFNGRLQNFTGDFLTGETIIFANTANENYCYESAVLLNPANTVIETISFNTKTEVV